MGKSRSRKEIERGHSAFKLLNQQDRLEVAFRAGGIMQTPDPGRLAEETKAIAGQPGAFVRSKGGSVEVARDNKSLGDAASVHTSRRVKKYDERKKKK